MTMLKYCKKEIELLEKWQYVKGEKWSVKLELRCIRLDGHGVDIPKPEPAVRAGKTEY